MPSSPSASCCAGASGGILSLGQGIFFGLGGYCMAMFLKLEASTPEATKIQSTPGIPDFMDWNQITALPCVLGAVPLLPLHPARRRRGAGDPRLRHRLCDVQAPRRRRLFRHHHPGDRGDPDDPDHRPAGLYRRRQRHHRPAHAATAGTSAPTSAKTILYFVNALLLLGVIGLVDVRASSRSSGAFSSRCATRRTGSASPATTSPPSRSSSSASRRRSPPSAGRCSPCRSASCRRPSSASCRRSRWSSTAPSADAVADRRGLRHAAGQFRPRRPFPKASPSSGCSPWARLFIAVVMAFPNGLAGLYTSACRAPVAAPLCEGGATAAPRPPRPRLRSAE